MKKTVIFGCVASMLCSLQAINSKREYIVNGQKEKQRINKRMQESDFEKRPSVRMKEAVKEKKKQNDLILLAVQVAGVVGLSLINTEMKQPGAIRATHDEKERFSTFAKEAHKTVMLAQKAQLKAVRDQPIRIPKQPKKKPTIFHTKDTCPHRRK